MKYIFLYLVISVTSCAGESRYKGGSQKYVVCNDPAPSEDDVIVLRSYVADARAALPHLPEPDRSHMTARLDAVEHALDRFERALGSGSCSKKDAYLPPLGVVAGGAAARVSPHLVAFALVGAVAYHLVTQAPTPPMDMRDDWDAVTASMTQVGHLAETLQSSPTIDLSDCQGHVNACLETGSGRRHSSGTYGSSICKACFALCRGGGSWPFATGNGKDCTYWQRR